VIGVALQTILTTLIPIYGYKYAGVFDKEKKDIEKIRSEYKDVYDRTDQALKSSGAAFLAFAASPQLVLGAWAAKKSSKAVLGLASSLTGGYTDEIYEKIVDKAKKLERWSLGDESNTKSRGKKTSEFFEEESKINESDDSEKNDITPKKILRSKKFLAAVAESSEVKRLSSEATTVYSGSLQEIYKQAQFVMKTKTIEDVKKFVGNEIDADLKKKLGDVSKLPPDQKAKSEKILIDGLKKASKEFYVKNLTAQVDEVLEAGIPEESQFVKDYRNVINKIKSL
jgi:hypothetical protein